MKLGGSGQTFSYAQLEGLWINAGGPRSVAPTAAAIAEAESSGNPNAQNPSGATGLWQILGNPFPGNAFDPQTNAKMAVAKYKEAPGGGNNFSPWVTFTSGAYKAFLSSSTTPSGVSGGTAGATTTATLTAADAALGQQCLLGLPNPASGIPVIGGLFSQNLICLFSKTQARALIGGLLLTAGGLTGFVGLAVLVSGGFAQTGAGKAAGRGLETVGAGVAFIPGAEGAGAGIAAAGGGVRSASKHVQKRRGDKETAQRRELGEPRENPSLEVGGGTIRESDLDRQRRKRRQAARSRRSVAPGGRPASREEAGF